MAEVPVPIRPAGATDRAIGLLFGVVGHVRRHPTNGYAYEPAASPMDEQEQSPLNISLQSLRKYQGLTERQVLSRLIAASELAVRVIEHVEPKLKEAVPGLN